MVTLSLRKTAGGLGAGGSGVRYLVDHVLGQGTTNGSNIGQRIMYLVLHIFTIRLEETEGPALLADRAADPELDAWCSDREGLGLAARRYTMRYTRDGYTDDACMCAMGLATYVRMLRAWRWTTTELRIIMAAARKRQGPTQAKLLGLKLSASLGVAWIPTDKLMRALRDLQLTVAGLATIEVYQSLLGLLLHLSFLAGLRRTAFYGMWAPFKAGGAGGAWPSNAAYRRGAHRVTRLAVLGVASAAEQREWGALHGGDCPLLPRPSHDRHRPCGRGISP